MKEKENRDFGERSKEVMKNQQCGQEQPHRKSFMASHSISYLEMMFRLSGLEDSD